MRMAVVVLIASACATAAHAEGSCNFTRQDNVEQCGGSVACLNTAFRNSNSGQGEARRGRRAQISQRQACTAKLWTGRAIQKDFLGGGVARLSRILE